MEQYYSDIKSILVDYAPVFVGALAILIIGLWLSGVITRWAARVMKKRELDPSLQPFLRSMISIILKLLVIISVLGMAGVEMTSFIAILGAATLAIGMALSGTFQNLAGGVMILTFKPFRVGDVIEAQGYLGSVFEIQIFNTLIKTPDNKVIIIPNGGLSTSSMTNYSKEATRRVDWTFGIGYGDDSDKAREVLMILIREDSRILNDPEPFIAISALADSSVNFTVRAWVKGEDYWGVFFDMNEKVYKTFGKEGLNIPFPQMDVHIQK